MDIHLQIKWRNCRRAGGALPRSLGVTDCNRMLQETELVTISRGGSITGLATPGPLEMGGAARSPVSFRPGGLRNPGRTQMKVEEPWAGSHSRAGSQGDLGGVPEGCTQTTWMSPLRFGLVLEPGGGGKGLQLGEIRAGAA